MGKKSRKNCWTKEKQKKGLTNSKKKTDRLKDSQTKRQTKKKKERQKTEK